MMKVVGYRDLRPVDWVSGKRMPLEAGEGHVCDRCGAEHAVVYEVLDTDTGKRYAVGSTCAQKQFGFEVGKDAEAKAIVKKAKERDAAELDDARQRMVTEAAHAIAREVSGLSIPEFVRDETTFKGTTCWKIGDSKALASFGRSDADTQKVALEGWFAIRVKERTPDGWNAPLVKLRPGSREKNVISMRQKTDMLAMAALTSLIRRMPS
jgi:hypothetical protein